MVTIELILCRPGVMHCSNISCCVTKKKKIVPFLSRDESGFLGAFKWLRRYLRFSCYSLDTHWTTGLNGLLR